MPISTLLKDIPRDNYVFTEEDFDTFKEIYWRDKSYEMNKSRKIVQQKLLNYNAIMYRKSDSTTGNIVLISDGNNITVEMNKVASDYKR